MDRATVEKKYMKFKILNRAVGIWPGQSAVLKFALGTVLLIFCITCLITQISYVAYYYSIDTMIQEIHFISAIIVILVKHGNYVINGVRYNALLGSLWQDWSVDRPKDELDIMVTYAEKGVLFCRVYMVISAICVVCFTQALVLPYILDIVSPKNVTRNIGYIYPAYYFVDEDKYRTLIVLHMMFALMLTFDVCVGCDMSYVCIVQHACGQLAVTGHRFKYAILDLSNAKELRVRQDKFYRRVRHSIQGHQHATKFYIKIIEASHKTYLFITVALVMISFSATLVKISHSGFSEDFIKDYTYSAVQLMHILFLAMQGQSVLNSNDDTIQSIYQALWYNVNKRTRLLLVLALRNCISPPTLSAGGIFILNLESFLNIIKASVSYFTVLKTA